MILNIHLIKEINLKDNLLLNYTKNIKKFKYEEYYLK